VGAGLISFADNVSKQGRYAEGEALLERALAIFERAHGRDHPEFANGLLALASLRTDQGRAAEAIALHERALAVAERTFPPGDPYLAEIRADIDALRGAM
jgi:tetratricopeptide (TPR) repeat protein